MAVSRDPVDVGTVVAEFWPGAKLLAVETLKGGISSRIRAFDIELPDGARARFVLREPSDRARAIDPHVARTEADLMRAAARSGVPVPTPAHVDHSEEPDFLVMTFAPGTQNREEDFLIAHAAEAAKTLARIHTIDPVPFSGLANINDAVTEKLRFVHKFENMDAAANEPAIRETLRAHWPPKFNKAAVLHGDFWPGNILWEGGRISAVLDWEDAFTGDPLYDLAISRLDWLWVAGPEGTAAFTDAYLAESGIDAGALPLWDLVAATRPLYQFPEWATGWTEFGRPDITEAAMRKSHKWFVDEALKALA